MAESFGYSPRETDALQVRDLAVMLHGALRKQRAGFQQAALVATKVHNMGGPRGDKFEPKAATDLYSNIYQDGEDDESWEEEVKQAFENYNPE